MLCYNNYSWTKRWVSLSSFQTKFRVVENMQTKVSLNEFQMNLSLLYDVDELVVVAQWGWMSRETSSLSSFIASAFIVENLIAFWLSRVEWIVVSSLTFYRLKLFSCHKSFFYSYRAFKLLLTIHKNNSDELTFYNDFLMKFSPPPRVCLGCSRVALEIC